MNSFSSQTILRLGLGMHSCVLKISSIFFLLHLRECAFTGRMFFLVWECNMKKNLCIGDFFHLMSEWTIVVERFVRAKGCYCESHVFYSIIIFFIFVHRTLKWMHLLRLLLLLQRHHTSDDAIEPGRNIFNSLSFIVRHFKNSLITLLVSLKFLALRRCALDLHEDSWSNWCLCAPKWMSKKMSTSLEWSNSHELQSRFKLQLCPKFACTVIYIKRALSLPLARIFHYL